MAYWVEQGSKSRKAEMSSAPGSSLYQKLKKRTKRKSCLDRRGRGPQSDKEKEIPGRGGFSDGRIKGAVEFGRKKEP